MKYILMIFFLWGCQQQHESVSADSAHSSAVNKSAAAPEIFDKKAADCDKPEEKTLLPTPSLQGNSGCSVDEI